MKRFVNTTSDEDKWIEKRTVDIYCPYCSVVSVVCSWSLSIVGEPDVDNMVF